MTASAPEPAPRVRTSKTERSYYLAALDLFAERGYHGTSLREIAKLVGKQESTLYYHYESKQHVLLAIMRNAMNDLLATVCHSLEDSEGKPASVRLSAAIRAHISFHGERAKEAFVADSEVRSVQPAHRDEILAMRREYLRTFEALIVQGIETGEFAETNARIAAMGVLQMCTGVAIWYRAGGESSLDDISDIYSALVVRGLHADPVYGQPQ